MLINTFLIYSAINLLIHLAYYLTTIRYTTINETIVNFLVMEIFVVMASVIVFAVDIIGGLIK